MTPNDENGTRILLTLRILQMKNINLWHHLSKYEITGKAKRIVPVSCLFFNFI